MRDLITRRIPVERPGFKTDWGHSVVFLGETLYSHSAFLHPGEEELLNCHENQSRYPRSVSKLQCDMSVVGDFIEELCLSCRMSKLNL